MPKTLALACVCALLACTSPTAYAQTIDNRALFTFSQPVAVPGGATLPAGTYLFRNPDTSSPRRVVQILSADGKQLHATLLAIPVQRFSATDRPEMYFMERVNAPAIVKTWWHPGNAIGWEFVYPKEQALQLAKAVSSSILTTGNVQHETLEEMKSADLVRVNAMGNETPVVVEEKPTATVNAGSFIPGEVAAASIEIPATPAPAPTASGQ